MNGIEEMITKHCPEGVQFTQLKTIAEIGTGRSDRKDATENGEYPFYVRSKDVFRIDKYEYDETAIVIPGEGGIGEIFHFVSGKYALHQRAYRIHIVDERINTKFVYYYMIEHFKSFINKKAVSATVTSIRKPMIEEFEIPVLSIDIQQRIVHYLDKFTELELKLTEELDAREKQYQYYLDLYFDNQTENLFPLSEVGKLQRGKRFVHADAVENDGVACIHYGELYTYYGVYTNNARSRIREELRPKMRYAHKGDVIIVGAGENNIDIGVGVVWDGEEDVAVHDACYTLTHNQNPKYISYYLRSSGYHNQIKKFVSEGKICSISAEGIGRAIIPIPPIEEQNRIVEIFDVFDAMCNDKKRGLQAEIPLRRKQYEYYREKLLGFGKE